MSGDALRPIRVTHIIAGLLVGGAETMLFKLLSHTDHKRFEPRVISISDVGPIGERIRALGVPVEALGMKMGRPDPRTPFRIARRLRAHRADVVQTWMYHADLVGGLGAWLAGRIPVAWNIRQSDFDPRTSRRMTRLAARMGAVWSRWLPTIIVCVSHASREVHQKMGYAADRMRVIPNGFDTDTFAPDPTAKIAVRAELGIPTDAPLIGLVGRFDPQKDHRTFTIAAKALLAQRPDAHFLLCGRNVDPANAQITAWMAEASVPATHFHRLGQRTDIPRLTAALDIATSSSAYAEGFSNVVGEAMASGVPCVVTTVGDSALIVGSTGLSVPPRHPAALAEAWATLLALPVAERHALGIAARARILDHYTLSAIAAQYAALHTTLASHHRRRG